MLSKITWRVRRSVEISFLPFNHGQGKLFFSASRSKTGGPGPLFNRRKSNRRRRACSLKELQLFKSSLTIKSSGITVRSSFAFRFPGRKSVVSVSTLADDPEISLCFRFVRERQHPERLIKYLVCDSLISARKISPSVRDRVTQLKSRRSLEFS